VNSNEQRRPDSVLSIIFPVLVLFLFAVFTGLPELIPGVRSIRPLFVIGGLGLIALAVTGRFMKVLTSPIGKGLVLFTIWFIICTPLAVWRGGSLLVFEDYWSKSFLAFVLTAGLITTASEARKVFHTIAYGVGLLAILALAKHTYTMDGRLELPGGRYSNSNDLAWTLLVGLIFIAYLYLQGSIGRKVLALGLAAPVLLALSKTGSRAILIGAGVLCIYVFVKGSGATRAKMIIVVPVLFVGLVMAMPKDLLKRYTTLFGQQESGGGQLTAREEAAKVDAAGSSEARLQLLLDSVYLTFAHPIFGVGPGDFQVAQNDLAVKRGQAYGLWHVTHNTYTELSCEMGIPGLLIYVAFLIQCWRVLSSIIRKKYVSKDVRMMARVLQAAFLVMVTVAFFESFGYDTNIPIVAGLIAALSFVAQGQRPRKDSQVKIEEPPAQLPEPEYEPAWSGRLY
jgi:O-antigen ligase